MPDNYNTKFVLSTGDIAAAIRDLPKRSTTAVDVAQLWLDILEIFFPDNQGFQRSEILSAKDRVLIQVQRNRDLDGRAIIDHNNKSGQSILVVDCRGNTTDSSGLQFRSAEDDSQDDCSFKYGVASFGAQVSFLKDVSLQRNDQEGWSLNGLKMGSSNLTKATGRDVTEAWLCNVRDLCIDMIEEHHY
ncbi:hypothetical protein TMatcc_003455 [Talaromyces marneffei ATCC 18224]|uniref:Uncharacterized protein n=1 Tax=Talaromyces marneffei PM1 TaxID=1077442 RepID=A0A093VL12_TALMA|nr:uncharacterized protein EYB26_001499 [Talaromyces marneffei]KAE8556133.1 hypothetical protein EYB25_000833 [Talaromyces marneffei]QGA13848.1 hypothetical protein EYB26_001499 [Talaromyces marneffei]